MLLPSFSFMNNKSQKSFIDNNLRQFDNDHELKENVTYNDFPE